MTNRKIFVALNLLIGCLFISCFKKGEPTIYLIPDGYRGAIEIVYDQDGSAINYKNASGRDTSYVKPLGEPAKYEGGSRVYVFPANGILLTQFKENSGSHNDEFFYLDSSGNRKKLKAVSHSDIEKNRIADSDEVLIFNKGTGSYGNTGITYSGCLVCSLNELKTKFNRGYYTTFDNQVKEVIKLTDF